MERAIIKKKAADVEVLSQKLIDAKTVIAFDYAGLSVGNFTALRNELRNAGCEVTVYKNNISKRASLKAGFENLAASFVGAKAIILSFDDVVAPAKIIADFAKKHKVVNIEAGVIEGKVVDNSGIMDLANLPSRETLLTQLAAGLLMPVRELTIGLHMLTDQEEEN